jgi:hypothetical protein
LQVIPLTLFLESATLSKPLILDLTKGPEEFARIKKEGGEFWVVR